MKKIFLMMMALSIFGAIQAQDKISADDLRFGLEISPVYVNSLTGTLDGLNTSGSSGIGFKLVIDKSFTDAASISTGIEFATFSGEVSYPSTFFTDSTGTNIGGNVEVKGKFVNIPLALKFKTDAFGAFTPFAMLGVEPGVSFGEDITRSGITEDLAEIELRAINFPLSVALGTEYAFSASNAVYASLFYRYGFTNTIQDKYIVDGDKLKGDGEKISLNNYGLRIGILF